MSIFDSLPTQTNPQGGDNTQQSGGSIFDSFGSHNSQPMSPQSPPAPAKTDLESIYPPELTEDPLYKMGEGISQAVTSTAAKIGAYFNNLPLLHKTTWKSFSPEQISAAKSLGIPLPSGGVGQVSVLDLGTDKYNDLFNEAVRKAGEDPDAIQRTIEAGEQGKLSSSNLANAIANRSLTSQAAKAFFNPSLANTKLYEETQQAADSIATLKSPTATPEDKRKATYQLLLLKAQNGGFTDSLKSLYEQFKKDPAAAAKGMLFSIGETPELALVGGGGDLGKFVYGAKAAQAESLAAKAAKTASDQIARARLAEIAGDTSAGLAKSKQASSLAGKALTLKRLQKIGDLTGSAATGAIINSAADAANQLNEKGYVSPGQAASSATLGAAFGAGAHYLHGSRDEAAIPTQERVPGDQTETAQTRQGAVGDVNEPHNPGDPIPANAPLDDTGTVPYTGGAAKSLNKTHIDKDFPNTLDYKDLSGKTVTLPVKDIVSQVHEAEEAPLMHPTGPVPIDKLADLVRRAGRYATDKTFSPDVLQKIMEGKPLSYPEAHEIATEIENNHVSSVYNVDPKEYQDKLKPFIKDIADRSEEEGKSDIPEDLDSKPYDDMDHPEVVSGASKDKSGGSIFDSLMDSTRPTGKINPHLLATGAAAGLGATAGAALSPQNDKRGGALAGGLAGLLLGINIRGESIPSRGFGNKESGMFAGVGARTFRLKDAKFAEAMERAGKDAKSIQLVTGMHRNAAGQWQFEISDRDMSVADSSSPKWKEALTKSIPLSSVVTHSKLEEAYPGILDNVKVRVNPDLKFLGGFDKKANTIILKAAPGVGKEDPRYTARSIISHELQHQVQAAEGNPTGSNVGRESRPLEDIKKYLEGQEESLYQRILEAERDGRSTDALESQYDKVQKQLAGNFSRAGIEYKGRDRYNRSAGEVQARNTQARLDLSDEERRSTPVSDTQDIPYKDQIVRQNKFGTSSIDLPPSESIEKENYRVPLSKYSNVFYHETNAERAQHLLPYSNTTATPDEIYLSNSPNLALGQGTNKGILIEFTPGEMQGVVNKAKPGWKFAWDNGEGEFVTRFPRQSEYQKNVQAVTIKKELTTTPVQRMRLKNTLAALEKNGWSKTVNDDGSITYRKPEDFSSAHEEPLAESLKKTGEMDEEGRLYGMVLPEDKLPGEASVIDRARSGDQRAYTQLYNQYSRRLTNAIRGYVREAGPRLGIDADDVVNAAFTKAFQNLNSFKGDSSFYTWLYRIARNESLNEITRSGRQVPTETMYNPSVGTGGDRTAGITGRSFEDSTGNPIRPSVEAASAVEQTPEDMLAARQASNMVQYAISKLPPDIREAIKLKELEGLSEQEIAQQKGIPVGTVKSRLSRGRDMIKQSLQKGHGALMGKQRGSATPQDVRKLAWAVGMGTLGATLGASLSSPEDKMSGFLTGAGVALAITPLVREFYTSPKATASRMYSNMIRDIKVGGKENISDTIGRWQAQGTQAEIINFRSSEALKRLVPKKSSRVKVTSALDTGNTSGLTSGELKAYNLTKSFLDKMGKLAMSEGVIHNVIDNYVTHLWKNNTAFQAYKAALGSKVSAAMSSKTPFSHLRSITSLAQGKKLGLTPLTEDISEILNIYTKSVLQAVRNKQLLSSLKATKDSSGNSYLVLPTKKSPSNYVQVDHPQLRGMSVHPVIAPELRNIFYTYDLGPLSAAASTLNMAIKRSEVSFSLFHLTSLMDAYLGGMPTFTHPIKTVRGAISSIAGNSDYHSALRGTADPATQQMFNRFLQSGGKIQVPHGEGADVDFNNNYYQGLQHLSNYLDSIIPHLGTAPSLVGKASHVFDHIIFENGMSGMKFSLWMNTVQRLNDNWAREIKSNPKATVPRQADLDRMASGFVNNLLGSQNWLLAAQQATTRLGRTWLNVLGSPTGRKLSQYLLFAPDWTTSTFMSFMKALGHGSGPRGIIEPKTEADLHRVYQIRSAAIYALLGGTLNLAMSGHYIWDNKDPTTIDMGNGQRLQWNKHWTEPYQIIGGALTGDLQPAYNKLGYLPHEFASQVAGKEYINLRGTSPAMREGRIAHVLKGFTPIPFQGFGDQTPQQIMWNLAGRNVLGHPTVGDAARTFRLREENKKREDNRKKYTERMSKLQEGK